MTVFKELEKLRKEGEEIELTEQQIAKIHGDCCAGAKVKIFWNGEIDHLMDEGYIFVLDGMEADIADCFIHVPNPGNPGGKDKAPGQWVYMATLLTNQYLVKIVCKS
jgi:hypothetical protein